MKTKLLDLKHCSEHGGELNGLSQLAGKKKADRRVVCQKCYKKIRGNNVRDNKDRNTTA